MRRLGIFGTSGMAREAGDIAYAVGLSPIYIAHDQSELDSWRLPEEVIIEADVLRYTDMPFVIGIGENETRKSIAQRFNREILFTNLIHPSATFGQNQHQIIKSCVGTIVCAGVRFTNNIQVGDFIIVNQNVIIAHDVIIDNFVHLAPGCIISGNVQIGECCWIGAGAILNQGSSIKKKYIGENTLIGSGSVVLNSCEPNSTYVGVPAKRIK